MTNIDKKLDETEYELKVSDRLVKSISSWGGAFVSWMLPKPKAPPATPDSSQSQPRYASSTPVMEAPPAKKKSVGGSLPASPTPTHGMTKEEEDLLDGLGQDVLTLKHQANLHKVVLDEQNRQLDAMNAKADKVQDHLHKTNRNVRKLL